MTAPLSKRISDKERLDWLQKVKPLMVFNDDCPKDKFRFQIAKAALGFMVEGKTIRQAIDAAIRRAKRRG